MKFALFDMDGSLFDYDGAMLRDLAKLAAPSEPPIDDLWTADALPHIKARMDLIKSQPCWWRNLQPIPMGHIVWDLAKAIGFRNQILTKGPVTKTRAWKEKADCCYRHFGMDIDIHITSGSKKSPVDPRIVSGKGQIYGSMLYDDYVPYMEAWLEFRPRGLGIMPVNNQNKNFTHPRVIKYDGSIEAIEEVKNKLIAVYNRDPGKMWDV